MDKTFAFVIHAGDDKGRIAPIIRRLIDSNIPIWIDDPRHPALRLGSADLARLGGCMIEGQDWPHQRNLALQAASSFLIIVSDASLEDRRAHVQMEAAIAEFMELAAGVPVFPLPLSPEELERGARLVGKRQGFKTYVEPDGTAYRLTERGERDVAALIQRLSEQTVATPRNAATNSHPSPYHADREEQSLEIADALRSRRVARDQRLLAPVTLGTREDRPDKFVLSQLPERLIPKWLRLESCHAFSLPWPYFAGSDPRRAVRFLVEEVLDQGATLSPAIFHAQPRPEDLAGSGLQGCLRIWCTVWHELAPRIGSTRILPILDVRTDRRPGLGPLIREMCAKASLRQNIFADLKTTAAALGAEFPRVELLPLTPFGRVTWDCVERWLREEAARTMADPETAALRGNLYRTFHHPAMTMESWAERARARLGQSG